MNLRQTQKCKSYLIQYCIIVLVTLCIAHRFYGAQADYASSAEVVFRRSFEIRPSNRFELKSSIGRISLIKFWELIRYT